MNKRLIILIVVILMAVIAGAGGYYLLSQNQQTSSLTQNLSQTTTPSPEQVTQSTKSSLRNLLTSTNPQKCSFQDKSDDFDSSGTIYIAGGKMRSDYDITVNGATSQTHTIVMDNQIYVWMDGQTSGFKMSAVESPTPQPTGQPNTQKVDLDKLIDYQCSGWNGVTSVFQLPPGITFSDMSDLLKDATSKLPKVISSPAVLSPTKSENFSDQCAACEKLTGQPKQACLQALSCI